jgi:hypothetical protein
MFSSKHETHFDSRANLPEQLIAAPLKRHPSMFSGYPGSDGSSVYSSALVCPVPGRRRSSVARRRLRSICWGLHAS